MIQYKRLGDDTFQVLVPGQRAINGRLKDWRQGLSKYPGVYPSPVKRSDKKWLTDKQYNG